jgi:hypothetical protein
LAAAQTMKVIFLDIDGVLNCVKTPNPRKLPYIVDQKLLARLEKLLTRTKAKVVLSSSPPNIGTAPLSMSVRTGPKAPAGRKCSDG